MTEPPGFPEMSPSDLWPIRAAVLTEWAKLAPHLDLEACKHLRGRLRSDPPEPQGNLRELRQDAFDAVVARLCELEPEAAAYYLEVDAVTPEIPDDLSELDGGQ